MLASKMAVYTKSSQILSKHELVRESITALFFVASVYYASIAHGCYIKYPMVSLFFPVLCGLVLGVNFF